MLAACTVSAQIPVYKIAGFLNRVSSPDTIYVLNFWATWCKPCVKELPAFDSLHVSSKGSNIKVILVSIDFADQLDTRVRPFIRQRNVRSECILLDEVDGNRFIDSIHPGWSGAIPATLVKSRHKKVFAEKPLVFDELKQMIREAGYRK